MDHVEFVTAYRSGTLRVSVDRAQAMAVCDRSPMVSTPRRLAHQLWKWIAFLLIPGGLVALIWLPWWQGLGLTALGVFMAPAVQRSAAEFVLETALENPSFFRSMVDAGVVRIS
jgi:hypothetical protein